MGFTGKNKGKNKGRIYAINHSKKKRTVKTPVQRANLIEDFGLEGDAHGGPGKRQVSLLAIESINRQMQCLKVKESNILLAPGDFAENITTEGLDLAQFAIGDRLTIGRAVILEISKIGKECHKHCEIYKKIGDCIMPREGIFARVVKGGEIAAGDAIVAERQIIHSY
ncbi:MAG: MOSC domain-containing protein [Candidatus Omnitrophota bacterium]